MAESWRVVAGVVGLLVVAALLLSTPSMIFARGLAVVDTELREAGPDPQRVLTKRDLADPKELESLPRQLGAWNATRQYAWDDVGTLLNAQVLLSRDYARRDVLQPVNLLVVQSSNVSSFHPAPVCYRVQGWAVDDAGATVSVPVPNATWAQPTWLSEDEPFAFGGNLTAKVLTATKPGETRIVLYVYLKREDWRVTNAVTWIRTEIAVGPNTTAERALPVLQSLLGEAVPELFAFEQGDEPTLGETLLVDKAPGGWAVVAAAAAVPGAVLATAFRRKSGAPPG